MTPLMSAGSERTHQQRRRSAPRWDVVLSVAHGHPDFNDIMAGPVSELLGGLLHDAGYRVRVVQNLVDRIHLDQNRTEARGTVYREAILDLIRQGARLHLDIHSFPPQSARFAGRDIVLLHTQRVQDYRWLVQYRDLLRAASRRIKWNSRVEIQSSSRINDIVIESVKNGQPTDRNALVEHNEAGDEVHYASAHLLAIQALLGSPG